MKSIFLLIVSVSAITSNNFLVLRFKEPTNLGGAYYELLKDNHCGELAGHDSFASNNMFISVADGVGGHEFTSGLISRFLVFGLLHLFTGEFQNNPLNKRGLPDQIYYQVLQRILTSLDVFNTELMKAFKAFYLLDKESPEKALSEIHANLYQRTITSTTLAVAVINHFNPATKPELEVIYKGDSLVMQLRGRESNNAGKFWFKPVYLTTENQAEFNTPFSFESSYSVNNRKENKNEKLDLEKGDIIIVGTDGFWDNIYPPITALLVNYLGSRVIKNELNERNADYILDSLVDYTIEYLIEKLDTRSNQFWEETRILEKKYHDLRKKNQQNNILEMMKLLIEIKNHKSMILQIYIPKLNQVPIDQHLLSNIFDDLIYELDRAKEGFPLRWRIKGFNEWLNVINFLSEPLKNFNFQNPSPELIEYMRRITFFHNDLLGQYDRERSRTDVFQASPKYSPNSRRFYLDRSSYPNQSYQFSNMNIFKVPALELMRLQETSQNGQKSGENLLTASVIEALDKDFSFSQDELNLFEKNFVPETFSKALAKAAKIFATKSKLYLSPFWLKRTADEGPPKVITGGKDDDITVVANIVVEAQSDPNYNDLNRFADEQGAIILQSLHRKLPVFLEWLTKFTNSDIPTILTQSQVQSVVNKPPQEVNKGLNEPTTVEKSKELSSHDKREQGGVNPNRINLSVSKSPIENIVDDLKSVNSKISQFSIIPPKNLSVQPASIHHSSITKKISEQPKLSSSEVVTSLDQRLTKSVDLTKPLLPIQLIDQIHQQKSSELVKNPNDQSINTNQNIHFTTKTQNVAPQRIEFNRRMSPPDLSKQRAVKPKVSRNNSQKKRKIQFPLETIEEIENSDNEDYDFKPPKKPEFLLDQPSSVNRKLVFV